MEILVLHNQVNIVLHSMLMRLQCMHARFERLSGDLPKIFWFNLREWRRARSDGLFARSA